MNNPTLCQISIMLDSNLPNNIDYDKHLQSIMSQLKSDSVSITSPINKSQWGILPNEIPRAIVQSENYDASFSPINFQMALKKISNNWIDELDSTIKIIDRCFKTIGEDYKVNYRLGIIVTVFTSDSDLMRKNVSNAMRKEIIEKQEWQLSYLDIINENMIKLNSWKRFNFNETTRQHNHIIDINTKAENNLNLRDNELTNIFNKMKSCIEGAYNEFK